MPVTTRHPDHDMGKPDFTDCEHECVDWDSDCEYSYGTVEIQFEGTCNSCGAYVQDGASITVGEWQGAEEICSVCECTEEDCYCWICDRCGSEDADDDSCGECSCPHCGEDLFPPMVCLGCKEEYACGNCYLDEEYPLISSKDYCLDCWEESQQTPERKNQIAKAEALERMAIAIRAKIAEEKEDA